MPNSPDQIVDPWFDERVEAYLDAELPDGERERFAERLSTDAGLRGQVALAEQISLSLATRERETCDPSLVERLALIRSRDQNDDVGSDARPMARVIPLRFGSAGLKPVSMRWSVGIAAAAVVVAFFVFGPDRASDSRSDLALDANALDTNALDTNSLQTMSDVDRSYSPEEIDEALREAKFALAIVGDAGRRAGVTLRESVIERNVVRPVNRAFENTVYGPHARKN